MTKLSTTMDAPRGKVRSDSIGSHYKPFEQHGLYEFFEKARATEPVFYCEDINYWVVSDYDEVRRILANHQVFTAENTLTPIFPMSQEAIDMLERRGFAPVPVQSNCLPPDHTRIRRQVLRILNREFFSSLRPFVESVVDRFCNEIATESTIDLAERFAYDIPALVVMHLAGVEESMLPDIKRWARDRHLFSLGALGVDEHARVAGNLADYWDYTSTLVDERIQDRRSDYISRLLDIHDEGDNQLSLSEVKSLAFALLLAGHETTANMMLNMFVNLLGEDGLWNQLSIRPEGVNDAVEECLRYDSSVVTWRRRASEACSIGGVAIPAGANVLLAIASANRDPNQFPNANSLDITRPRSENAHLSFGIGIHKCVGAELARMELQIALRELTKRFPSMSMIGDSSLNYIPLLTFRGPSNLHVRLQSD